MRALKSRAIAGALLVGLVAPRSARAAEVTTTRPFSLEYRAADGCPDATAFEAQVRARTPTAVHSNVADAHVQVELLADGTSLLEIDLPEGSSQRKFWAASCAEAVASLAVIVALVLDTRPSDPPPSEAGPKTVASLPADPGSAAAKVPSAQAPARATPARVAEQASFERPTLTHRRAHSVSVAVSAGALRESAVSVSAPLGVVLGIQATLNPTRAWSPSARAELLATSQASERTAPGTATFRLVAGRVNGCVTPFAPGARWRVSPCALVVVGALTAEGAGTARNTRRVTTPWLSFGAGLRAEVEVWRGLSLEASTAATLLTRRDRFVFRPQTLVYELPQASWALGLGFSVRLW